NADLLWRNYSTGANTVWLMSRGTLTSSVNINPVTDTSWHIAGSGDTTGDGIPDIIWRNTVTGQNVIWFMTGPNGTTLSSSTTLQTVTDQNWKLGAVASYDGNPIADLLWRNQSNGQTAAWLIGGGAVGNTVYLPTEANLAWRIFGPR